MTQRTRQSAPLERPVVIVKVGATEPTVRAAQRGDFEHWFSRGMELGPDEWSVVAPFEGDALPSPDRCAGIVVTGSSAMITDRADWSERTKDWLAGAVDAGRPVLAICYGHHLLADAFGGRSDWNPNGREIGTVQVELEDAAADDPLLHGLGSPLIVQESHSQAVLELPPTAKRLAHNAHDPCQGFRLGAHAWSFQFHPEFTADIVRGYITARREAIESEGLDVEALFAALADDPAGQTILARFGAYVRERAATQEA